MQLSKRRARIVELLQRLNDGHDINVRDMKIVLTNDENNEFIEIWNAEKDKRNPDKPQSVKDYEQLLKSWHLAEARVERYRKRQSQIPSTLVKMNTAVDTSLETIQECLQEHQNDTEFRLWLDRDIKSYNSNESFDPDSPCNSLYSPPLVVTSRSVNVQSKGILEKVSKRDIKKMVLTRTLEEIDHLSIEHGLDILKGQLQGNKINKDKFKDFKV